jgi:hypothetical protein
MQFAPNELSFADQRGQEISMIQKHIGELGQLFGQLNHLIATQGEQVRLSPILLTERYSDPSMGCRSNLSKTALVMRRSR